MIPEGGDDVELRGANTTFVQIKSRREQLGDFSMGVTAQHIRELWNRCCGSPPQPDLLELVLERNIVGFPTSERQSTVQPMKESISGTLADILGSNDLTLHTSITVSGSPQESSIRTIADRLNCSELAAQMCFAELLVRVGELADVNGTLARNDYRGLSVSDTEGSIRGVLGAVDTDAIEKAIHDGICEPVDFITPLYDSNFYLGVDVEPGHVTAGLVSERPRERAAVAQGIDERRSALVVGPSGAGKSAIMWETAHLLRHTVRWFRIRRLAIADIPAVRQLIRTFRASRDSPVGFVMDDIGRHGPESWGALLREVMSIPGVVMLGSVREEDVTVVAERARSVEVRADPDQGLAERLWHELKDNGRTDWAGWREPWQQSEGLLLEYVHILNRGRRMRDLLSEQVAARISDPARSLELDVLRSGAWAGTAGAEIDASRLARRLLVSEDDLSRALRRLIQEHLVRSSKPGILAGLHQLRSEELLRLTHRLPLPTLDATFGNVVDSVHPADLESLTADALSQRRLPVSAVVDALANRLDQNPDPLSFASACRGLGSGRIAAGIDEWLGTCEASTLPPTQIAAAAMMGVSGGDFSSLDIIPEVQAAVSRLSEIKGSQQEDPRHLLVERLSSETLSVLIETADINNLEEILCSLVGTPLAPGVRSALERVPPTLLSADLSVMASVMGTLAAIDRGIAEDWATRVGQNELLRRIEREIAWTGEVSTERENQDLVVNCDLWYVAGSEQGNPHNAVVTLCELLLALCPAAEVAKSRAITSSGKLAGLVQFPLATKAIPRANLPPQAVSKWNRRWIDAATRRVAACSYSDYLARGVAILDKVVPALEEIFDAHFRGKTARGNLFETLNSLNETAEALTPPAISASDAGGTGNGDANTFVTKFQNLLHSSTGSVIRRFATLPDQAGAYISWLNDLISNVETVRKEEPWHLIAKGPPKALGRMKSLLETLRLLAGEAHQRQEAPVVTWLVRRKIPRAGNALRSVSLAANAASNRRLKERKSNIERTVRSGGIEVTCYMRVNPEGILPWPPTDVLVLLQTEDVSTAVLALEHCAERVRSALDTTTHLTLVPFVDGMAIPALTRAGHQSLLPDPEAGASWLRQIGFDGAVSETAEACGEALALASELGSMDRLNLGLEDHPIEEIAIRQELTNRFEDKMEKLDRQLRVLNNEITCDVLDLIEQLRSGDLDLAAEAQAALDCRPSDITKRIGELSMILIEYDLRSGSRECVAQTD